MCVDFGAPCCCKLPCPQKSACCQGILPDLLSRFGQPELPAQILWVELSDSLPAKQRVFMACRAREKFRGLAVLIDGFFGMILFLLQERIAGDAFRRLCGGTASKKTIVDGQRLGFIARINQQIEEQLPVVNGRALRLIHPRIKVAQRLRRFLMLRRLIQHRQIRFDSVLDAVLFEESLCAGPGRLPERLRPSVRVAFAVPVG